MCVCVCVCVKHTYSQLPAHTCKCIVNSHAFTRTRTLVQLIQQAAVRITVDVKSSVSLSPMEAEAPNLSVVVPLAFSLRMGLNAWNVSLHV